MYGDGWEKKVSGLPGDTLLNVAQINDIHQIEGRTDENTACCV